MTPSGRSVVRYFLEEEQSLASSFAILIRRFSLRFFFFIFLLLFAPAGRFAPGLACSRLPTPTPLRWHQLLSILQAKLRLASSPGRQGSPQHGEQAGFSRCGSGSCGSAATTGWAPDWPGNIHCSADADILSSQPNSLRTALHNPNAETGCLAGARSSSKSALSLSLALAGNLPSFSSLPPPGRQACRDLHLDSARNLTACKETPPSPPTSSPLPTLNPGSRIQLPACLAIGPRRRRELLFRRHGLPPTWAMKLNPQHDDP